MKAHIFRTVDGWAVYAATGELFEVKQPELTYEEVHRGVQEMPEGNVLWTRVVPGHGEVALTLNVSHACNLRCTYCYADHGKYGGNEGFMSPYLARHSVKAFESRNIPIGQLRFFGGEPLMNMDAMEAALDELSRVHVGPEPTKIGIVTNGTLVDRRLIDMCRAHDITVTVSLDGPREVHDRLRPDATGHGSYSNVLRGIERLLHDLTPRRVRCEATYTKIHQDMGMAREDVLAFIHSIGVPLAYVVDYMGKDPNLKCSEDTRDLERFQEAALDALVSDDPWTDFEITNLVAKLVTHRFSDYMCPLGISTYLVNPEGTVYPCNLLVLPQFALGSILDPNWMESTQRREVLRTLEQGTDRSRSNNCLGCWGYHLCGGCPARLYFEKGHFALPEPAQCAQKRKGYEAALRWLAEVSQDEGKWSRLKKNLASLFAVEV